MTQAAARTEWAISAGVDNDQNLQRSVIDAIYQASPEGILVVDTNHMVLSHNARFLEVWQFPEQTLQGTTDGSAVGTHDNPLLAFVVSRIKDAPAFLARVRELYANPALDDHCEIELLDGRTIERHSTGLRSQDGTYLGRVWFFLDISRHKAMELALRTDSRQDALTGVSNRRHFFELASQEISRAQRDETPLCLITFDIDHFKRINDQYGHAVGDETLKEVCASCLAHLRKTDIFARIGGEEFALLLPNTTVDEAQHLAERLRQSVESNTQLSAASEVHCTISMGITPCHTEDANIECSLLRADRAMYRAKHNGRNCVSVET